MITELPAPEAPASIGWITVSFFAIMAGLYYTLNVLQHFRAKKAMEIAPQPLIVRADAAFATKEELDELKERVDGLTIQIQTRFDLLDQKRSTSIAGLHRAIESKTDDIRKEIKTDMSGIHERVTDVLAAFSEMKGRVGR